LNMASGGVAVTSTTFTSATAKSMQFYGVRHTHSPVRIMCTLQVTNSCLADAGFTSTLDVCLGNPAQCSLTVDIPTLYSPMSVPAQTLTGPTGTTGLSMSVWMNVPSQLSNTRQYIIDTGWRSVRVV
jgi:hypothetical protein